MSLDSRDPCRVGVEVGGLVVVEEKGVSRRGETESMERLPQPPLPSQWEDQSAEAVQPMVCCVRLSREVRWCWRRRDDREENGSQVMVMVTGKGDRSE